MGAKSPKVPVSAPFQAQISIPLPLVQVTNATKEEKSVQKTTCTPASYLVIQSKIAAHFAKPACLCEGC
jgi:hypothetical protein